MIYYVYVIVRTDIPMAQQMVQVAHACLEAAWEYERPYREKWGPLPEPVHVCLQSVPSEDALHEASERLDRKGIHHYIFWEPDMGPDGQHTAIATAPIPATLEGRRAIFNKYPMWEEPKAYHALNINTRFSDNVKHDPTRNIKYITGDTK